MTDFGGEGKVEVRDKTIVMAKGGPMTGVTYTGKPPKSNYELTLEGKRAEGSDFFCTTTFPVGDKCCSFVTGGWGGSTIGLSNVDHMDASENETSKNFDFKSGQWYKFRIRVTDDKIEVWIDDKQVVSQDRKERTFGVRIECDPCCPLGIATYDTVGAVRNIRLRELKETKVAAEESFGRPGRRREDGNGPHPGGRVHDGQQRVGGGDGGVLQQDARRQILSQKAVVSETSIRSTACGSRGRSTWARTMSRGASFASSSRRADTRRTRRRTISRGRSAGI